MREIATKKSKAHLRMTELTSRAYVKDDEHRVSLDEWCLIIAEWLINHDHAITVLDFYSSSEREKYMPFEYRLEEVLDHNHPAIYAVLSERILRRALVGTGNERISKLFLNKRKFEEPAESVVISNGEMTFKFGE